MLYLGIDLGTQSLKAALCDDQLTVRGQHAVGYATRYPAPDRAEQDPRDWEAALAPAIAGALAVANARADDVSALAITGQLDGCVAVDASCTPLHPALIWQDRRAVAEAARVDPRELFAITGQVADPGHMAPKATWLHENCERCTRFHQPVSYLVERLTGVAVLDPALASTTMLLELAISAWSPMLLDAFALEPDQLPRIRPAGDVAGALTAAGAQLTGLRAGTPVAVGTGDDFAAPIGAGVVAPGAIICVIGTAEVVGGLSSTPILDRAPEPMVETHVFPATPARQFFIENPGWMSGGAVRWAARMLGISSDAEFDALAASAPPGAGGVTFIPALAGAMTPVWRPHARGTLHGLAASHDRSHIARAVLEGLACATRDVVGRLAALGLPAREVVVVGGGSRSALWNQIRANLVGVPHHIAARSDAAPIGAAMLAASACGLGDLTRLAERLPPPAAIVAPDPHAAGAAADTYERYQRLVGQLAPLVVSPWVSQA